MWEEMSYMKYRYRSQFERMRYEYEDDIEYLDIYDFEDEDVVNKDSDKEEF